MNQPTDTRVEPPIEPRRIPIAALVAIIAAIAANVVIYLLARTVDFIPDDLPVDAEQIGIPAIIVATTITVSVAALALWLFVRFSRNPVRNFYILSAIVFVTSAQAPLGIEDASTGLVVSLLLMHSATAIIAVFVLTRLSRAS